MPFLGQDWRSPGEHWVKDKTGNWSKMDYLRRKLLVNLFDDAYSRENEKIIKEDLKEFIMTKDLETMRPRPFIILKEVTREQQMRTQLAEALVRLDVAEGVKDIKKFNYICRLMLELIKNKMSYLSGTAQKNVMVILEQIAMKSQETNHNKRAVRELLTELQTALEKGENDHVGSCLLWLEHYRQLEKLKDLIEKDSSSSLPSNQATTLCDLPDELMHAIFLRLDDHVDLANIIQAVTLQDVQLSPVDASRQVEDMSHEITKLFFYKQLCLFHFPDRRIWSSVLRRNEKDISSIQWDVLFNRLIKRYGPREDYADMLHLCRHCNALFWKGQGHPCCLGNLPPASRPVPPGLFAELFSN